MKFVFSTLGHVETDFYGRVGRNLAQRGHEVAHLTWSRRAAWVLRRRGDRAYCLADLMSSASPTGSWADEERRILDRYGAGSLEQIARTDPVCRSGKAGDCTERTLLHFLAIEDLFDRLAPDVVVPEVGNEAIREVSHLVGRDRGATTMYLMYTLFDRPLRLYENTLDAPIVDPAELRELTAAEDIELDDFMTRFVARNQPIREHRGVTLEARRAAILVRHLAVRATWDRDNEYLTPIRWLARDAGELARGAAGRRLYRGAPGGRYVYFPLQVADDYKILGLRPDLVDQANIVERLVTALPDGFDLVIKEHPMSIGRNDLGMLRRLAEHPRIALVNPRESSLELARDASAVATISSTVGMEALMLGRPVLTLGQPFYAGYGVTVDAAGLGEIGDLLPQALAFEPDRERTRRFLHAAMRHCYPGAPVLVDRSDANAAELAGTLDLAARGELDLGGVSEAGLTAG